VKEIDSKKFYIVNMSDRKDGGSHWTLLFQNLYFDSFGCPPTLAVKPHATVWNDTQYQDFHSSACGFYCIYVADNLLAGRPPEQGLIPDDEETPERSSEHVLRTYFDTQVGEGFFSRIIDRFRPRKAESERLRKFLDGTGSQEVTKVEIARKPVVSFVTKALDVVSLGKFSKKKKELGYDDIYHNYLLVTLKDGSTYKVEKNHQVESKKASKSDLQGERSNVPLKEGNTLKQMMETASKGDNNFWRYDAQNSNCQDFTREVLTRNGLKPDNDPPRQDGQALIDTLPLKGTVPKLITDAAAYADKLVYGGAVNTRQWY
jgi:hypothetical protein